jgi:RNA polymerase sigma factor (TIGR02999 family)
MCADSTKNEEAVHSHIHLESGSQIATSDFVALVYHELRMIASSYMASESAGHTLGPTALIHEVYLRIMGEQMPTWESRAHFLSIAAKLMRQVLINHAISMNSLKRGGSLQQIELDKSGASARCISDDVLALNEALIKLRVFDPQLTRIVELRYFAGLTIDETAEVMELSPRKIVSSWTFAKAWLSREL